MLKLGAVQVGWGPGHQLGAGLCPGHQLRCVGRCPSTLITFTAVRFLGLK